MRHWWIWILCACLGLSACQQSPGPEAEADLPTIAALPTLTFTPPPSATPIYSPTATLTATATASLTPTITLTVTPSITITDTPTPTFTATASITPLHDALFGLAELAARATVLPQTMQPPVPTEPGSVNSAPADTSGVAGPAVNPPALPACAQAPSGGFGTVYANAPDLAASLGCPVGGANTVNSALENFERGNMIWIDGPIYVLYIDGRLQQFTDTFVQGVDPDSGGETPPPGLYEPVRGFGKVWRSNPDVRSGLGWGTTQEMGGTAVTQRFDHGWMIDMQQRSDVLVLLDANALWQSYLGSY